jgi:hypothetical protein
MTTSALVTLLLAWSIVAFFTIRFFVKVLKKPQNKSGAE